MRRRDLQGVAWRRLPVPALGIVFKGKFRIRLTDGREETVNAGEAYYIPPRHRFKALEDTELVEPSPKKGLDKRPLRWSGKPLRP